MKFAKHSSRPAMATRINGQQPHIQYFGQNELPFANVWVVPRTLELQAPIPCYQSISQKQTIFYPHPIRHYPVPILLRDARLRYRKEKDNSCNFATKFITLAYKRRFASKRSMPIQLRLQPFSLFTIFK